MDYRQSLEYLYGLQQFGIKLGLDNVKALLERLGHPEQMLSIVHVAGTNGKGSTAAALAKILTASGNRTGLYTSPHLQSFTERIQVDGVQIGEQTVADLTCELKRLADDIPVTFFELSTVLALEYFRRQELDIVVLETGLGGRLDATNAVVPRVSLITPVAQDHQQYLGVDIASIAAEKAGIIKPGVPVLSAKQEPAAMTVLQQRCMEQGATLQVAGTDWHTEPEGECRFSFSGQRWQLNNLPQTLAGKHQLGNLGLALAAAELLQAQGRTINVSALPRALNELSWPGRLEWVSGTPAVLLDGAHNPGGARALSAYLEQEGLSDLLWVAAFKDDKSWMDIVACLKGGVQRIYVAPLSEQASIDPAEVVAYACQQGLPVESCCSVDHALREAVASAAPGQVVLVAGSLFLVGEVRSLLAERLSAPPAVSVAELK